MTPATRLHVALLNGFRVETASGQPLEIAAKKTRALLAYLALPAGRQHTREALADLLWSDRGDKQARASLRQALGELRRVFDDAAISALLLDHDQVALDSTLVEVDVAEFERLAGSARLEDLRAAATLYAGELFLGYDVADPAYADWLRAERDRLQSVAGQMLKRLLDRETGHAAITAGRRLLELEPLGEEAHRTLMRRYAEAGEIGAALKQYEKCREILQRELSTPPSPETEALHQQIRNDPSAFATARRDPASPVTDPGAGGPDPTTVSKPSIAVLPFGNLSGDPAQQHLSDGLTNDLIADLSRFSGLLVIASNSAFAYKGKAVDVRQVSRELGVRYVIEGSIQREGGRVRVNAQLIDAASNAHLWARRYDREAESLLAIQDELIEAIVTELAVKLDLVERDRAKRKAPDSLSAYDLWQRSRDHLHNATREDNATARRLLERAVELDPHDPRYSADLALAHHYESRWGWSASQDRSLEAAEGLARKAVRDDDGDYRTHWVLATVLRTKSNFDDAQSAYERAISLNPNDADLLADFGGFHSYRGKPREAIRRIEHAMRLNPLYPDWYIRVLCVACFCVGDYQRVVDLFHKARRPHPGLLRVRAAAHVMLGQRGQAEAICAEVMTLEPWFKVSSLRKGLPFEDPAMGEPLFAAMRNAGMPE